MNFQTVSTAEKLPSSDGLTGGYLADGNTPGPLLQRALNFVDGTLGAIQNAIRAHGLTPDTVIILSAKHGQSPQSTAQLTRIPDGPILDGLDAAWEAAHPGAGSLVAFAIDDDGMLIWLTDRSAAATSFARTYLLSHDGVGNDINGDPKPYTASGLRAAYAGADAAAFFGVPAGDARVPDVLGISQVGVVYTGKKKKIAEHGGDNPADRSVPLLVTGARIKHGGDTDAAPVETTQIAPTILQLLGLDPDQLESVQIEGTAPLPLETDNGG
jgi:arylsulfatase A-like enzyme